MATRGRRRFTAEEAVNLLLEDSGDDDFLFESSEGDDLDELFTVEDLQDDDEREDEKPSNSSSGASKRSILGLSKRAQLKLSLLVGDATMAGKFSEEGAPAEERRRRCHVCLEEIARKAGYKQEKDRLPKMKTMSSKCGQTTCSKHLHRICDGCA